MDGSKQQPKMTAGLDLGTSTAICASSTHRAARLWRRVCSAHQPRNLQAALRLRAASYAHSDRGRNPLALGKQGARGVRPRGPGGQRQEAEADLRQSRRKTDEIDALRTWLAWRVLTRSYSTHSNIGAKIPRPIWP